MRWSGNCCCFQRQLKYCHITFYMCSCMEFTFYVLYDLHSFWIPALIVFHHIMVDFKVFATESPASIQPCAIIPPTTTTTNQGRMDSPWTPGPVLSIVHDPNVTRGEEYCPNPPWHGLRQKPTVSTSDSCFLLFPSSLCSWLFSKILHFQSGEAGWVRKSVWRSKCNGTWESLEFMLMMLFIGTHLEVKLVFFLIKNKRCWTCLV